MFLSHISKRIVYTFVFSQLFHWYEKLYNKNSPQSVVHSWGGDVFKVESIPLIVLLGMLLHWMAFHIFATSVNIRSNNYW